MIAADAPLVLLAFEEQAARGELTESNVAGALYNLQTAESLGQIRRDVRDGICTGFCAWVRLTYDQFDRVLRQHVRLFRPEDNSPGAPVLFVVEQLNTAGLPAMQERRRMLSSQPGVELIGGWRGGRMIRLPLRRTVH